MLAQEFLAPLNMTQVELAERIGVPFQRVNQIVRQKRAVTPDTALRLARLFGTSAEFWLNLQQAWDLYQASHSPAARDIAAIEPIKRAG
jgi:addiction module HigA family antidote